MKNRSIIIKRLGVEDGLWNDLYHRLMRLTWPRFFALSLLLFLGLNLIFALLFSFQNGSIANIKEHDLFSYFAFSVQTFSTVGYGYFYPQTSYAHVIVTMEAATGMFATAVLTGLIFAKFSRPFSRVVFSNQILWTSLNGEPALTLRLGNFRTNAIFEGRAKLTLLRDETSKEGEKLRRLIDLKLVRNETPLFALSWTLFHIIDNNSPFFGHAFDDVKKSDWEIYTTFIGLDQDMGQETVATSYYRLDQHLLKARKFADMITYSGQCRTVDFSKLHDVDAL